MRLLGVILFVAGVSGLIWGGARYTAGEAALNQTMTEWQHVLPVAPLMGLAALCAGAAVLARHREEEIP
jgi:hypothetical protein